MARLDKMLTEFYKLRLFSVKEIDDYTCVKEQNKQLAVEINRALGLYYADVTQEIETYVAPWLALGFSAETLKMLAMFCFRCRIQTLEGMNVKLRQLASKGCLSRQAIVQYVDDVLLADGQIAEILDTLGLNRSVCATDRKNFKLWTGWGLPFDLIRFSAEKCYGSFNPMATLNKTLADFKQNSIFDVMQAQSFLDKNGANLEQNQRVAKKSNTFLDSNDREYSAEELSAMFEDLKED